VKIKNVNPWTGQKKACVVRYGAYGDAVLCSPIFKQLKAEGYWVVFNCTERCAEVQYHNPNIDSFWIQETGEIPNLELIEYWKKLASAFDRFINLSESIERRLLCTPDMPEYEAPKETRHELYNRNYMDETMSIAGYPEIKGAVPDLHFKSKEERWATDIRETYKGFLVVVCLSGSSLHKTYPYADSVVQAIVETLPDAMVLLVGEAGTYGIIDPHPQIVDLCGKIGIRKSFILTRVADLVISPETSVANASSAFDTPKIILLSHSSEENLTKYWKNCFSILPPVQCFPCHQLHYTRASCPLESETNMPVCVALLHPKLILEKVGEVYAQWKGPNTQFADSVSESVY
jgi:ADP-heptose:LPS heptosyltransferase